MKTTSFVLAMSLLRCLVPSSATGQILAPESVTEPVAVADSAAGTRRALIVSGHPGDDEHRALFAESVESLHATLVGQYGFPADEVRVLFGAEATEEDGPAITGSPGPAERGRLLEQISELRGAIRPDDTLWVVVLGHAHFDGRRSWLNLPGPDLNDREFGEAFRGLECREQLFLVTTPVSGYFVKGLSAKGRVVVTATEADLETNETLFHRGLVEVLRELPENTEYDADADGRLTLFDLYIAVTRNVADQYVTGELVMTEHAQLDDNGDGHATELQRDYLTEAQGGRAAEGRPLPTIAEGTDGWTARTRVVHATRAVEDSDTAE